MTLPVITVPHWGACVLLACKDPEEGGLVGLPLLLRSESGQLETWIHRLVHLSDSELQALHSRMPAMSPVRICLGESDRSDARSEELTWPGEVPYPPASVLPHTSLRDLEGPTHGQCLRLWWKELRSRPPSLSSIRKRNSHGVSVILSSPQPSCPFIKLSLAQYPPLEDRLKIVQDSQQSVQY